MSAPTLLVAGSIALDTLEGGFGRVEDELGGSALYTSLAARLIMPVKIVAPVGPDAVERVREVTAGRNIDLEGLDLLDAPTYRWHAVGMESGHNQELGRRDQIYDLWRPRVPAHDGWAFVGSMRTGLQLAIARQLHGAQLLAADSMRSYALVAPAEAGELIGLCHWFFANQEELAGLGGDPGSPNAFRRARSLRGLCLKAGRAGAAIHVEGAEIRLPAAIGLPVIDATGAGDALAGGLLARWHQLGGDLDALSEALLHGIACASLAIETVGLQALARAGPEDLTDRVERIRGQLPGGGFCL